MTGISLSSGLTAGLGAFGALNGYWGQRGAEDLKVLCDSGISSVTLSFVNTSPENDRSGWPGTNFGPNCWADTYSNGNVPSKLYSECRNIKQALPYCRSKGVKILLSIGGMYDEVSSNYKVTSERNGEYFANFLYDAFGPYKPGYTGPRPFDLSPTEHTQVDGFDLDLEFHGAFDNKPWIKMVETFRRRDAGLYISAAPQCPTSDDLFNMKELVNKAQLDALFMQFYNNEGCDAIRNPLDPWDGPFNYDEWVGILARSQKSKNAKLFVGLPASILAAGSGYISPAALKNLVCANYNKKNWGGISLWDLSEASRNVYMGKNYYQHALDALQYGCGPVPTTTIRTSTTTTAIRTSTSTTAITTTTSSTLSSSTLSSSTLTTSSTTTTSSSSTLSSSTVSSSTLTTSSATTTSTTAVTTSSTSSSSSVEDVTSTTELSTSDIVSPTSAASSDAPITTTESLPATSDVTSASEVTSDAPVTTSDATSDSPDTTTTGSSDTPITTSDVSSEVTSDASTTTESSDVPVTTSDVTSDAPITTSDGSSISVSTTESSDVTSDAPVTTDSSSSEVTSTIISVPSSSSSIVSTTLAPITTTRWSNSTITTSSTMTTLRLTTSTIYTTKVQTITKCPPYVNCPDGGLVITKTIAISTTVCPVIPTPTSLTTSTVYASEVHTVTSCPPEIIDCPIGQPTTVIKPIYTTVCPAGEEVTITMTTSTAIETSTVTACLPGADDCSVGDVTTQTFTSIYPVEPTDVPGVSAVATPSVKTSHPPGGAVPTGGWHAPVPPPAVPSTPATGGASGLTAGLAGLLSLVALQLFAL
ncbi:glycoside hydrolase superfamily [Stachybotrys elegans]|uniref:chitinase n=1 Tax=Stachybotrys elegans TaxID=80388 RepID=A0A8K0WPM9_9HYPO|nr:glycoside hydrolase superfamily [Stachybotrys elegans]